MKMGHIREVGMLRLGNFCDVVLNSTVYYFEMLFCIEAVVYHGGGGVWFKRDATQGVL